MGLAPAIGCSIAYRCLVPIADPARICEIGKTNKLKWNQGTIECDLGGGLWRCNFGEVVGIKNLSQTVFTVKKLPDFTRKQPSSPSSSSDESFVDSPPQKKANTQDSTQKKTSPTTKEDPPGAVAAVTPCQSNRLGLGACPEQQTNTEMVEGEPDRYTFDRKRHQVPLIGPLVLRKRNRNPERIGGDVMRKQKLVLWHVLL